MSRPTVTRGVLFGAVLAALLSVSYAEGRHGIFSDADRQLEADLDDPDTRSDATVAMATRLAVALADGNPVFPGQSAVETCPGRFAAQASTIIAALPADRAGATVAGAATRLHEAGWIVDNDTPTGRRSSVRAHNPRGLVVTVTLGSGKDTIPINVTLTVPCEATP